MTAAVLLAAVACGKGTEPIVPTSITVSPASLIFWSLGISQPLTATVKDQNGKPIANAAVTWASSDTTIVKVNGAGLVTSGNYGYATVVATSGKLTGSAPISVLQSQFDITLRFLTATTQSRMAAFDSAAATWSTMIIGDLTNIDMTGAKAGTCGGNSPALSEIVDDVLIFVTLDSIDGPGGILGASSPCYIRQVGLLPIVGAMIFDTADVATLEGLGQFRAVALHEMGHVIGFGTVWDSTLLNLLAGAGGSDPHFIGGHAQAHFDSIGGTSYTGGLKVPVENTGGAGTRDAHWRESVFGNELMTGFLNASVPNPISRVTVASFQDEGYVVNLPAAQPYTHTFTAPPLETLAPLAMGNDLLHLPLYVVDERGRVVGVLKQ